jgi:cell division septum initiation protein DivIVA
MLHKFIKSGENTVHNDLIGVDIKAEIAYLIRNNKDLDERLVSLLEEVAVANESVDTVNLFVVKYLYGEISQQDLLIAINKYKSSKQSVVD